MIQRWSNRMSDVLRTNLRRGALFAIAVIVAITMILTPLMSKPANAAGFTDLTSLGGSFTNGLSSCAIETVGWVICPTMRSIAKLADYGFSYINKDFLRIDYNLTANNSGTYKAWEIMRNVANALFVVAFMMLIYSQLTGKASGGYTIKRLLPRLVITAILVNVSYFLCVILIEASNIVGDSILAALIEVAGRVGKTIMPIGTNSTALQDGTLSVITSSIMSKTATAWVLLAPVAAVVVSIATICAAGFVLLIMRKTIVALLVLASPLLFVAYLLPNLEKYFYQGTRLFFQLLLLYPIIALLLGAGQIVSATIVTVGSNDANYRISGDSYFSRNGGSGSAITDLTAAAAAVLPLLAVWFVFSNMSSMMTTAGSRLSATVSGRRGGKDDEKARVTGKATAGAAANKNTGGIGGLPNRRQAYSRNRRHTSAGGSNQTGESDASPTRAGMAAKQPAGASVAQNALDSASTQNGSTTEDAAKRFEDLQNARLEGTADDMNIESAVAQAVAGNREQTEDKKKTAKDIFNSLNHGHESKDKDRKLGAGGPMPAGGSGGQPAGNTQPSAPSSSYKAPSMAQSANIVTGSAPQQPTQVNVIAVPVQIDGSALLGQQNHSPTARPPENMSQPPASGTEAKAKERAQKYLFDADKSVKQAGDAIDIMGHHNAPIEPPHTSASEPTETKDGSS